MSSSKITKVSHSAQLSAPKFYGASLNSDSDDVKHEPLPDHLKRFAASNGIDKTTTEINNHRYLNTIQEKFKPKAHHVETAKQRVFTIAFSYFIHVITFAVSFAALYAILLPIMPKVAALGICALILIFIELGKRYSIVPAIKAHIVLRKLDFFSILIALCCLGSSLYLVYSGSGATVELTAQPITLSNGDSITKNDRNDIEDLKNEMQDTKKHFSYKGKLTETGRKEMARQNNLLALVQNRISIKEQDANFANKEAKFKHEIKISERSTALRFATIFLDLLLVVFLFFLEQLDYHSYLHLLELQKKQTGNTPSNAPNNVTKIVNDNNYRFSENNVTERPTIGFKSYKNESANENRLNDNRNDTKIVSADAFCEQCLEPYLKNHKKQKFCNDKCRIKSWELSTGKKFNKGKSK